MIKFQTRLGDIQIKLHEDKAPLTCANFKQYVEDGFYNGVLFHRVIPGFMIQGGGFEPGMNQKTTRENIKNEADNGLVNSRGTLAMARTNEPHSASSQFFINVVDNGFLNHSSPTPAGWGYCVFAEVVEGMDVADAIIGLETGAAGHHQDVPVEDICIDLAVIVED